MDLEERTAKSGRRYLLGNLNGIRVLLLRHDAASPTDGVDAIWTLFVKPYKSSIWQKRGQPPQSVQRKPARAKARPAKPPTAQQKALDDIDQRYAHVTLDDPMPF